MLFHIGAISKVNLVNLWIRHHVSLVSPSQEDEEDEDDDEEDEEEEEKEDSDKDYSAPGTFSANEALSKVNWPTDISKTNFRSFMASVCYLGN